MKIKEIRKKIRECKSELEFYAFREHLENQGIRLFAKRWGYYEPINTNNGTIYFEDDGSIYIQLPPAWSMSYKDIKIFSYNVSMTKENKPSFEEHFYRDKLKEDRR